VLGYDDVEIPVGRLCDALRQKQDAHFFGSPSSIRPRAMVNA
jgi:hypothetical protein